MTRIQSNKIVASEDNPVAGGDREIPLEALHAPMSESGVAVEVRFDQDDVERERFMQEIVVINIPESPSEGELSMAQAGVNGQLIYIPRGRNVKVKRMFVEALLNAKTSVYTQQVRSMDTNNIETPLIEAVGLAYPIQIVDDTPRGKKWAAAKMQQRA